MSAKVIVECLDCGYEYEKDMVAGVKLEYIICGKCLSNNVVFRHFYLYEKTWKKNNENNKKV